MRGHDLRPWIVLAALVALQIFWSAGRTYDTADETWFLLVAKRMLDGETLYRDVYFNTTPLSMYVTAAAVALTGVQLLTVKLVVSFSVLASILLAWKIIERAVPIAAHADAARSRRRIPLLLIALVIVYGNYQAKTPYTPLAVTFYLTTLLGFVSWRHQPRDRTLFWSGVAAGLSFASKYNLGVLAAGALALAVLVTALAQGRRWSAIVRALAAIAAGFSMVVAAMLAVIAASGGMRAFLEYAFLNKITYVAVGSAGYVRALRMFVDAAREPLSIGSITTMYVLLYCAVPVVVIALLMRWLRASDREQKIEIAALAIFVAAALAGTYPRGGSSIPYVVPVLGAIGGIAWRRGAAPRNRLLRTACVTAVAIWLGLGFARMLTNPIVRRASGEWRFSHIAHNRGVLVQRDRDELLLRRTRELRAAVPANETFIQTFDAGFYYLATGLRNPTPYDFPAVTTFGPTGQQKVIAAIAAGRIEHVVDIPHAQPSQVPRELMQFVETTMTARVRNESFTVYSRR
jgi:4-amino-4-deoxy-L-arabinose transferase-like glycosyltransferase